MAHLWQGIINEYRDWLPVKDEEEIVTLQLSLIHISEPTRPLF